MATPKKRVVRRTKASVAKVHAKGKKPRAKRRVVSPLPKETAGERVLALDSSSKCCGWSVFENGALVTQGRFIQQGKGHGQKLSAFRQWILQMLEEFAPTQLAYEKPYSGRMRNTFGILSRYAGVIEIAHFEHFGYELPEENALAAHLIKKVIGAKKGKNHEQNKKIVLLMVNKAFGLSLKYKDNDPTKKTSQDDEADAIAVNWAWHLLRSRATTDEEDAIDG